MEEDRSSQEAQSRVTREHAEQAEIESRQAWSQAIDRILESRAQQGDYFVKIGEKRAGQEGSLEEADDGRVIALRTPTMTEDGTGHPRHIVITRDGPYAVTKMDAPHAKFDIREDEFIKRMEEIKDRKNEGSYVPPDANRPARIHTGGYGSHEKTVYFDLTPVKDEWVVQKAIKESVQKAESPHKARAEAARAKSGMAGNVGSFVSELPPR